MIARGANDALARETERVLCNDGLANSMGLAARAKIASRFSLDAMVDGMERVYDEVVH